MSDFKNVEMHDTVWDLLLGWGKVSEVHKTNGEITFIQVKFNKENLYFYPNGCAYGEKIRRLFWDEVIIPDPPRPKRKVMKKMYINIYTDTTGFGIFPGAKIYESEAIALNNRDNPSRFPNCQTIPINIEVEE